MESLDSAAETAIFSRKASLVSVRPSPSVHCTQESAENESQKKQDSDVVQYSRPKLQRRKALWERNMIPSDSASVATDPAVDRESVISELTDFQVVSNGSHLTHLYQQRPIGPQQDQKSIPGAGQSRRYAPDSYHLEQDEDVEYWVERPVPPTSRSTPPALNNQPSMSPRESAILNAAAAAGGLNAIARTSGSDSSDHGRDGSAEIIESDDIVLSASLTSFTSRAASKACKSCVMSLPCLRYRRPYPFVHPMIRPLREPIASKLHL